MNEVQSIDNVTAIELNVPYHVTLENCLVSWGGNLFTPQPAPGKDIPEYSITVFIPNSNKDFQRLSKFTTNVRTKYPISNQNKGYTAVDIVQSSPQRMQHLFDNFKIKSQNQDDRAFLIDQCGFSLNIEEYSKVIAKTIENNHIITAGTDDNPIIYKEDPKLFYEGTVVSISYYLVFYGGKVVDGQQQQFFCKRTLENVHFVHPGFSRYRDTAGGTSSSFSSAYVKKPRFLKNGTRAPNPDFITQGVTVSIDDDAVPF